MNFFFFNIEIVFFSLGSTAVLKRSSKLTVYEARKQLQSRTDPVEENVKRLLLLSGNKLDSETSEKVSQV